MHLFKTSEKYFTVDPWTVVEKGFAPAKQRLAESIFSVANEFMCVRGYFEEGYSGDHLLGSYFSQLYDMTDIKYPQVFKGFITEGATMINTVDWLYTRISLDGEELDLGKVKFSDFRRTLDLKNATLKREFIWTTATQKRLRITFLRFTNIVHTAMGCQRIILEPLNFCGEIKICSGLDFDTLYELAAGWDQTQGTGSRSEQNHDLNFWTCERRQKTKDIWAIQARTRRSGIKLFSSFRLVSDQVITPETVEREKFIGAEFSLQLTENQVASFDKIAVNHWEQANDVEQVWSAGLNRAQKYGEATYDATLEEHSRHWADFWRRMDVEIEGDPELQQGVRYSLYALYINYHGESERRNVLCKLGGEVYNGVNFWDTEIYCHRLYMFLNPEIARKLLMYRYHYLPKALENAKRVDLEGARYPFATLTGVEEMGTWQHVELEIHQNEAIYYAIWHYDKVCGDKEFLYNEGIEMLLQMCRCMASWGGWSPKNGDFGFYGVMGPDEFHMMVNHNCYTNYLGKKMFNYTLEVLEEMRREAPELYELALAKAELRPEEPAEWRRMAEKMRILKDEATGIYEQHDGYFDLPHLDVKNIPVSQIPIYKHWAYIKIFRFNMIKQPDFLNLPYFFSRDFTMAEKKANYEFYEARTSHESSLSPSLHAILAAELGKLEESYHFLAYAARLDLDNYNRNTEQGIHSSSAAGVWAGVVSGFGGLRTDGAVLTLNPTIPASWKSYGFKIFYRGALIEVKVNHDEAIFRALEGPSVQVGIYDQSCQITAEPLSVKVKNHSSEI
ncbi:maltose phosphorylase [Hydrogenispora ethanolica]|uniref:Maltose phosphorylase n=1 Tax=Hydrogenispora ethanolica TaxID=1082276 RepID=A0A4R1RAB6_HYDET|nr:glycosyl hydrolase family 65 protein [Hydrogenispora ethanolica]TCL62540.1 maltose phosphorylase [Hydrogenispora ethanolica]